MHAILSDLGWRLFGFVVRMSSKLPFSSGTSRLRQSLISRYMIRSRYLGG